jgi:hypothetical protein
MSNIKVNFNKINEESIFELHKELHSCLKQWNLEENLTLKSFEFYSDLIDVNKLIKSLIVLEKSNQTNDTNVHNFDYEIRKLEVSVFELDFFSPLETSKIV